MYSLILISISFIYKISLIKIKHKFYKKVGTVLNLLP